jgi:hypothetical protein
MPAGQGAIGYVAFAGVKFVGYTLAALALKKAHPSASTSIIKVGLARTGIGIVTGALFGGTWLLLSTRFENRWPDWMAGFVFFGLLIPIRLAEWSLLIHLFFDRGLVQCARDLKYAAYGNLWSFVLDGVGIVAAFVVPGGFWIC